MPLQDLEEHGVLLPEEERGTHPSTSLTPKAPLFVASGLAIAGCVAMYVGGGDQWTWIGLGAFFLGFFALIVLSDRAVSTRRARIDEIRSELGTNPPEGSGDEANAGEASGGDASGGQTPD